MVLCIVIYGERDRTPSRQEETYFLSSGRLPTTWATHILVAGTVAIYKAHFAVIANAVKQSMRVHWIASLRSQ
jgi:hypothetical protein